MDDIYKILDLDISFPRKFSSLAKYVVSRQTENMILNHIDRLRKIDEDLFVDAMRNIPQQSIDEVIDRVVRETRTSSYSIQEWSNKELRILSYYLNYLHEDDKAFTYAMRIMRSNWKDFLFNGLVIYLLKNWLSDDQSYLKRVRRIVSDKLESYNKTNSRYAKLKQNVGFLDDESGAMRMATLICMKNLDLEEAPRMIGFSPSFISSPYFSDVILKYIEKIEEKDINVIGAILEKHNFDRTRKLALAYLVLDADENGTEFRQNEVGRFARRILGDTSLASSWSPFPDATVEDVSKLRLAKDTVRNWSNRNVIRVFFEKCVKDPVRQRYWLKRSSSIVDFRIAGTEDVKYILQKDERTSSIVSRYYLTSSYKQDTALILCIKDKVFVEFSVVGCLYVYNHDHPCLSPITRGLKYINKTSIFKATRSNLIEIDGMYYFHYNQGRMSHRGDWVRRLESWFRKIMDNRDAPNIGFTPNDDDKIFVIKQKAPEIRYLDDIKYMLASKDIPAKKGCFVVVNRHGYYIYLPYGMRYAFIKPLSEDETPNGALFIRANGDGWFKVVHVYMKIEQVVFYLTIENRNLLYKFDIEDTPQKLKL